MNRRKLLCLTSVAALSTLFLGNRPAMAEPIAMKAAEIETLLAGNTISGTWNGSAYQQYYKADGFTIYLPAKGANDEGKWRTADTEAAYESWWSATGWTAYKVLRDGESYFWVDKDGKQHPFSVQKGKQVSW